MVHARKINAGRANGFLLRKVCHSVHYSENRRQRKVSRLEQLRFQNRPELTGNGIPLLSRA
jgi:hypothetical protein